MKARCQNPASISYPNYGARGITVCDRWQSFENFYADMGDRPRGMSLDRIDVNGNYEPANCQWATPAQQAANQRTTKKVALRGEVVSFSEAARRLGISTATMRVWAEVRSLTHQDAINHYATVGRTRRRFLD